MRGIHLVTLLLALTAGTAPPPTGLIMGRVVDGTSTRGVPHAVVTLSVSVQRPLTAAEAAQLAQFAAQGIRVNTTQTVSATIESDNQGRFVFGGLAAGQYSISASADGFLPGTNAMSGPAKPIQLADGQRIGDTIAHVWRPVTVGGRVFDETGEPMAGIDVQLLFEPTPGAPDISASGAGFARTDDRGAYRFTGRPAGRYGAVVVASYITSGGLPSDQLVRLLGRLGGDTMAGLGSTLSTSGSFYVGGIEIQPWGSLAKATPPPKPGAQPQVYPTTFSTNALVRSQATLVQIDHGEERKDIDVHVRLVPSVRVSGRLVSPDGKAMSEVVRLVPVDGSMGTACASATDAQGRFSLLAVTAGEYRLVSFRNLGGTTLSAMVPLTIGYTDISNVVLTLSPEKK